MTPLQSFVQKGESEHLEFKASFGKEAIEALCAFANTRGGRVLIGINDKGNITGVQVREAGVQSQKQTDRLNIQRIRYY
jgi:ATP-dependent DNA helicase RecG